MKSTVLLCSLVLAVAGTVFSEGCASGTCPVSMNNKAITVSTEELDQLITSGAVTVLDARPGAPEGLPGAKSLTGTPSAEEAARVIPAKDSPVITYCGGIHCPLSERLATHLKSLGYTHVREYPEGFSGWKNAGKPTVSLK